MLQNTEILDLLKKEEQRLEALLETTADKTERLNIAYALGGVQRIIQNAS